MKNEGTRKKKKNGSSRPKEQRQLSVVFLPFQFPI